jgi:hypothetical protein
MNPVPSYLRNTEAVVKVFGYWPRYHDAGVFDFRYAAEDSGVIEVTLHAWEMTAEVDERGYFKLIKHHLVQFAFREISGADLERFTSLGNSLFEMGFSTPAEFEASGKFRVDLDSAMGGDLCGSFFARTGEVVGVAPCDAQGRKAGPARAA